MIPDTKRCGRCGLVKPVEEFSPTHRWCRPCKRAWDRAWDAAHRARRQAIGRDSYRRRRGVAPDRYRRSS